MHTNFKINQYIFFANQLIETSVLILLFFGNFICSFPQKIADRPSPAYAIQGNTGGYVYLQQQQHYMPPQQVMYQQQMCHQVHSGNGHQASVQTLNKKGSIRNGDVLKRTRTQNA